MASNYISPISMDALSNLCQELGKNNYINAHDFERYQVKRGLRNSDGTGGRGLLYFGRRADSYGRQVVLPWL